MTRIYSTVPTQRHHDTAAGDSSRPLEEFRVNRLAGQMEGRMMKILMDLEFAPCEMSEYAVFLMLEDIRKVSQDMILEAYEKGLQNARSSNIRKVKRK